MLTTAVVTALAYRTFIYVVRRLAPEGAAKDTVLRVMIGPYPTTPK